MSIEITLVSAAAAGLAAGIYDLVKVLASRWREKNSEDRSEHIVITLKMSNGETKLLNLKTNDVKSIEKALSRIEGSANVQSIDAG